MFLIRNIAISTNIYLICENLSWFILFALSILAVKEYYKFYGLKRIHDMTLIPLAYVVIHSKNMNNNSPCVVRFII